LCFLNGCPYVIKDHVLGYKKKNAEGIPERVVSGHMKKTEAAKQKALEAPPAMEVSQMLPPTIIVNVPKVERSPPRDG
jgi:hypothetical protein